MGMTRKQPERADRSAGKPWRGVMGIGSAERPSVEAKAESFLSLREDAEEERDEMMEMETEGRRKGKG